MQPREIKLAIAVGVLAVLVGGWALYGGLSDAYGRRSSRLNALTDEIGGKQKTILRGAEAEKKLVAWRERSLPADTKRAATLYQDWLREQVTAAQFSDVSVTPSGETARPGVYHNLAYKVACSGTLDQLTKFLFEFHSAKHLHQIRRLTINRNDTSKQLKLLMTIEAMSLPGAARTQELNPTRDPSWQLAFDQLDAYRKAIVDRNLLAEYVPPPPQRTVIARPPDPRPEPPRPRPPQFDPSRFAYVTALTEVEGTPQVWINIRTQNKTLKLEVGDSFEIGPYKGKITRIGVEDVEIEADGRSTVVPLGECIHPARSRGPENAGL